MTRTLRMHDPPGIVTEAGQRGDVRLAAGLAAASPVIPRSSAIPGRRGRRRAGARTALPAELAGSQTTRSGMSAISTGTVIAPRPVATVTLPPSAVPASAAVAADIRATAARAVPARFGSPSCIRPASSRLCQVARSASPAPGCCTARGADRRRARSLAGRDGAGEQRSATGSAWSARGGPTLRRAGRGARPSRRRARPARRRSVRAAGTGSAALNEPGRPSQFTNVPCFSATAATGNTTSARSVTALTRSSRLTTKPAASIAASAAAGSGRSSGSTPPISRASMSPRGRGGQDLAGAETGIGGQRADAPGPGHLAGDLGLADPAAAGQQVGQRARPRSRPARRPGAGSRPAAPRCARPAGPRPIARPAPRPAAPRPGSPRPAAAAPRAAATPSSAWSASAVERGRLGARHGRQQHAGQLAAGRGWPARPASRRSWCRPGPPCAAGGTRSGTPPPARTRPAAPPAPAQARRSSAPPGRPHARPGTGVPRPSAAWPACRCRCWPAPPGRTWRRRRRPPA